MSYTSELGALSRRTTPTKAIKLPGAPMAKKPSVNKLPAHLDKAASSISTKALLTRRMPVSSPPNKWVPGIKGRRLPTPKKSVAAVVKAPARRPGAVTVPKDNTVVSKVALTSRPTLPVPDAGIVAGAPPAASAPVPTPRAGYSAAHTPAGPSLVRAQRAQNTAQRVAEDTERAVDEFVVSTGLSTRTLLIGGAAIVGAILLIRR